MRNTGILQVCYYRYSNDRFTIYCGLNKAINKHTKIIVADDLKPMLYAIYQF